MTFEGRDAALLASGLVDGNTLFFFKQTGAALFAGLYAFLFTIAMLWVIDKITPVRVSEKDEELGLDESEHGETAYL